MCADGNQAWRCTRSRSTDKRIKHPVMESASNHTRSRRASRRPSAKFAVVSADWSCRTFSLETRFLSRPQYITVSRFHPLHLFGQFIWTRPTRSFDHLPRHESHLSSVNHEFLPFSLYTREFGNCKKNCKFISSIKLITPNAISKSTSISYQILRVIHMFNLHTYKIKWVIRFYFFV